MTASTSSAPIPITVTLTVNPAEAIRSRHATAGPHVLRLTADDLAILTDDQRDTLARHVSGQRHWAQPLTDDAPPIGHASVAVLADLLDLRRAYATEQESADAAAAERRAQAERRAELLRADAIEWAQQHRTVPIYLLEQIEIPQDYRSTFPSVHTLISHLGRAQERIDHHREKREREEHEQRQRMASALQSAGFLELALLYARNESREREVNRSLRRWVRCVVGCVGAPSSWTRSNGNPDPEGTPVAAARAADIWTRRLAERGVVWPDGFSLSVQASVAWRPAVGDEVGDSDKQVKVPAVAFVLTCPDGSTVVECTTVEDRPLASPSNQQRVETQQRIAAAVRAVPPARVAEFLAMLLGTGPIPEHVAAILSASLDPAVIDALKQVAQARAFEE